MLSHRLLVIASTAAVLAASGTVALARHRATSHKQSVPLRVRGTIVAVDDDSITVKERDGRAFRLKTGTDTTYADVVPSSLREIKVNDYIGTAVKGPREQWVAVEIVLVPESMQAGRKGAYPWDPLPDTSGIRASGTTATKMTNGPVSGVSPTTLSLTKISMTNGTVAASDDGAASRTFTVNLVGDKPARITASSVAPIVRFVPSGRSSATVGSATVVWTVLGSKARLVAVGKGVTPPM